jgi:hypothetical protein
MSSSIGGRLGMGLNNQRQERVSGTDCRQAHFGASVFWLRCLAAWEGEQAAVEYWQAKRGGGQRGIVEITPEAP